MKSKEIEHQLRQMRWPDPPPALRARVLAEVRVWPESITWSDRVWFSRAWRVSMAALVVVVLTIRAWPGPRAALSNPSMQALAEARAIEETGREIGLPDAVAASFAGRVLVQSRLRTMTFNVPALPFLDQEETRRD